MSEERDKTHCVPADEQPLRSIPMADDPDTPFGVKVWGYTQTGKSKPQALLRKTMNTPPPHINTDDFNHVTLNLLQDSHSRLMKAEAMLEDERNFGRSAAHQHSQASMRNDQDMEALKRRLDVMTQERDRANTSVGELLGNLRVVAKTGRSTAAKVAQSFLTRWD